MKRQTGHLLTAALCLFVGGGCGLQRLFYGKGEYVASSPTPAAVNIQTTPANDNSANENSGDNSRAPDEAVAGGVLDSKAKSLPKPAYPPAAKAVRAEGPVVVEVLVDEQGNVIYAKALSGHPLLRSSAENAARAAKFPPETRNGKPVKVKGTITYNYKL